MDTNTMKDRAKQYLEKKDKESGSTWTKDDDSIVHAFIDFTTFEIETLKQQLSSFQADNLKLKSENEKLHLDAAELRSLKQSILESGLLIFAPKRQMSFHDKTVLSIDELKADNERLREALSKLYNSIDSCIELTPAVLNNAKEALKNNTQ